MKSRIQVFHKKFSMKFKFFRLIKLVFSGQLKIHTGQYGEDIVLHKIFRSVQPSGFYVDVGAHHPFAISNTAYLWARGWKGANVDASEEAIKRFQKTRPKDINICAAVVPTSSLDRDKTIRFYFNRTIDNNATCDPEIAKGRNLANSSEVKCISLKQVIEQASEQFGQQFDLLNIDIEGLDEGAIEDITNWPCHPRVLMIEIYAESINALVKNPSVNLLIANGYKSVQRMGHTAIFEKGGAST